MCFSLRNTQSVKHPNIAAFFDLVSDFVDVLLNGIKFKLELLLPFLLLDALLINCDGHLLILLFQLKIINNYILTLCFSR